MYEVWVVKNYTDVLIQIAKKNALNKYVQISSIYLAKQLNISQQSASRKIHELEREELITRTSKKEIKITQKGLKLLKEFYFDLRSVFEDETSDEFEGVVVSGDKEGAYYLSQETYRRQIKEKCKIDPYPGTLNVELEDECLICLQSKLKTKQIILDSFRSEERLFGEVYAYPIVINNNIDGLILLPARTHHPTHIIEIVSQKNLRETFSLVDGSKIKFRVK